MKESLIINFNLLKEHGLSVEEFLFISDLYFENIFQMKFNIDKNKLEQNKYIKIIKEDNKEYIILRIKSKELIEFLITDIDISFSKKTKNIKKSKRIINEEIENRIDEYRFKWKGLKAGSMGSSKSCKQKLTR